MGRRGRSVKYHGRIGYGVGGKSELGKGIHMYCIVYVPTTR